MCDVCGDNAVCFSAHTPTHHFIVAPHLHKHSSGCSLTRTHVCLYVNGAFSSRGPQLRAHQSFHTSVRPLGDVDVFVPAPLPRIDECVTWAALTVRSVLRVHRVARLILRRCVVT